MPAEPKPVNGTVPIRVRRETQKKLRDLFGKTSHADQVDALIEDAVRRRRIKPLRDRIIGVEQALAAEARRITLERHVSTGADPRQPPPSEGDEAIVENGGSQ